MTDYEEAAELILLNVSKDNPLIHQQIEMAKTYAILALAKAIKQNH